MPYRIYNPATDTLKVGMRIKFAGREGTIKGEGIKGFFNVLWLWPSACFDMFELTAFPLLEIEDKPLTISKALKAEMKNQWENSKAAHNFWDWFDSLEEVE